MDLRKLLHSITYLRPETHRQKFWALSYAFENSPHREKFRDIEQFIQSRPMILIGKTFGNAAEDFYYTSMFSLLSEYVDIDDWMLAVILNRAVGQLNFQTRYLGNPSGPELFLSIGPYQYLFPAMANGNIIRGCAVTSDPPESDRKLTEIPEFGAFDLRRHNLIFRKSEDVKHVLDEISADVGCVALWADYPHTACLASSLRHRVTQHTFYVVYGEMEKICSIAWRITQSDPSAEIDIRSFTLDDPERPKSILIGSGFGQMPEIFNGT